MISDTVIYLENWYFLVVNFYILNISSVYDVRFKFWVFKFVLKLPF